MKVPDYVNGQKYSTEISFYRRATVHDLVPSSIKERQYRYCQFYSVCCSRFVDDETLSTKISFAMCLRLIIFMLPLQIIMYYSR